MSWIKGNACWSVKCELGSLAACNNENWPTWQRCMHDEEIELFVCMKCTNCQPVPKEVTPYTIGGRVNVRGGGTGTRLEVEVRGLARGWLSGGSVVRGLVEPQSMWWDWRNKTSILQIVSSYENRSLPYSIGRLGVKEGGMQVVSEDYRTGSRAAMVAWTGDHGCDSERSERTCCPRLLALVVARL
jgi:hypothetical protein